MSANASHALRPDRLAPIGWMGIAPIVFVVEALRKPDVRGKLEEQDMIVAWAAPAELLTLERESLEAMRSLRTLADLKPED